MVYDLAHPVDRVVEAFGREVVGPDGCVDRKIPGSLGKPAEMAKLTAPWLHHRRYRRIDRWRVELGPGDVAAAG
jgi:hypothetical protein